MRYVAVLKREDEVLRFFNSLTQEDAMESCGKIRLLDEGGFVTAKEAKGLVNDGLVPIVYRPTVSVADAEEAASGKRGNDIIATLLLAAGYCAKCIKRRPEGGCVGLSRVKEISDLLLRESRRHFALLHQFEEQDKNRMSLYDTSASLWLAWIDLSKSAENLEAVARDLQTAIGEKPELA